uniref:Probable RNA-binding protein 19 n=1 Tax=Cyclopterus lumpus TaxID=8103 RepID=A0A8C2XMK4_CYCLU
MSRLIVKNLPDGMKEERFRSMFAAFGTVTDCSLKFTKDGKFRKFGFVGFKAEDDANGALKHFNKSFVDTSRVTVEMCKAFGDPTKAKAWSKHTQISGPDKSSSSAGTDGKKKKETDGELGTLEEDQGFKEFLSVHQNRSQAQTWANDTVRQTTDPDAGRAKAQGKKKPASDDYLNFDSEQSEEEEDEDEGYVYVDLHSDEEVEKSLKKNKDYIGGRYIEVFRVDASGAKGKKERKDKEIDRNFTRELKEDEEEEDVAESGRLFIRNLPYTCTEEEITELFSKYGPLSETLFPIDNLTKKPKGFAFVMYMIPENAVTALAQLDGHIFQGRMLHLLPSTLKKEKTDSSDAGVPGSSTYKRQKDAKNKAASSSSHNWNTLFLGTSAVADAIAEKYNTTKSQVLDHESKGSLAVRMALGETQIVQETRQFLLDNGVSLDSFSQAAAARSTTVILVKNLPAGVTASELEELFSPHGSLGRVLLPPSGLTAIIEFLEPTEAKRAFTRLAYSKFHHIPLYLEWAPVGVFLAAKPEPVQKEDAMTEEKDDEEEEESAPGSTLFIKNLNFSTTEEKLQETFSKCGKITSCTVSKKKDKTGTMLSMGYGFVQYQSAEAAQKALKKLQGFGVACKPSKKQGEKKQTGSKILVRNVPFQASVREIRELFCTFGELKTVRLPKKAAGSGNHRGFGFIDFLTKQDAKKAFAALCHSTHLYGRRLVLEWADAEETVETLRRKTAEHFHVATKKQRKADVMEGIKETMETGDGED